jgi:hypothetical protein
MFQGSCNTPLFIAHRSRGLRPHLRVMVPGFVIVIDAVPALGGGGVQSVVMVKLGAFGLVLLAVFSCHSQIEQVA